MPSPGPDGAGSVLVALPWLLAWGPRRGAAVTDREAAAREVSLAPFILWAAPLSWIHHQLLLWPLLAWLWHLGRRSRPDRLAWGGVWALLNATGELLLGKRGYRSVHELGIPSLAYLLLGWWGPRRLARNVAPEG